MIRDFRKGHDIEIVDVYGRIDQHVVSITVLFGVVGGARACKTTPRYQLYEIEFFQQGEGLAVWQNVEIAADDDPVAILRDVPHEPDEALCLRQSLRRVVFALEIPEPVHMGDHDRPSRRKIENANGMCGT